MEPTQAPAINPPADSRSVFSGSCCPWWSSSAWCIPSFLTPRPAGAVNATSMPGAVAQRIAKVGTLEVADNSTRVQHTGEEVFKRTCTACHSTGALGSPKYGDAAAWAPRIATGFEALLHSALKGKNNMTPQGGGEYDDNEVARAVVYMANAGGAKFAEPKSPAAAASAPVAAGALSSV